MRPVSALLFVIVLAIAVAVYRHNSGNHGSIESIESLASKSASSIEIPREPPPRLVAEAIRVPAPEPMAAREHIITFGNGREITVSLKESPRLIPYYYPTVRFLDIYYDLAEAALSGESVAAIQLFRNLKACKNSPRSKDELDRILKRVRDEGMIEWPAGGRDSTPVPTGFDYTVFEENVRDNFVFCEGITDEQTDNYEKWARTAVNAGDYFGTRFLTEELGRTQESFELWQQAWDQGHITGVTALILYYRDGNPDHLGGQPDYIQTYAYQLIRNKIYEAADQSAQFPNSNRLQAMNAELATTGGYLSPHEQEEAEVLAADILEANDNCCYGSWGWAQ